MGQGVVKVRGRICNRTVQALTYQGMNITPALGTEADCIKETGLSASGSAPLGALTKVDRILTVYFTENLSSNIGKADEDGLFADSNPQQFGSSLEN